MKKLITPISVNLEVETDSFELPLPTQCPNCSVAYSDEPLTSYFVKSESFYGDDEASVYAIYFCPHCDHIFLVHYHIFDRMYSYNNFQSGYIAYIYPSPTGKTNFTDRINALSPKFIEIYHQSERAENDGLTEICGMGYRKSLEFLIKDYAIAFNPDKEADIAKSLLSPCINEYIDNKRIKSLATASAWIGNDETHYTRKHEDYNIEHLKLFISAVVSYIDSELAYRMAENLLSNPKK